jgi:hypothetical protein
VILTNKHFIVAMIVTPILAIIAYFATDYMVSERPHTAVEGNNYPLVAKSNCRYESGKCSFKNGDIEIDLESTTIEDGQVALQLTSKVPLQGAKLALANANSESSPTAMLSTDDQQTTWQIRVRNQDLADSRLMLVISIKDTLYYGETETTFTAYDTGFSQANMQ